VIASLSKDFDRSVEQMTTEPRHRAM